MTEKPTTPCSWNRPLSLPVRLALCVALGAALAVSNDPATGIALASGLFVALLPAAKRG